MSYDSSKSIASRRPPTFASNTSCSPKPFNMPSQGQDTDILSTTLLVNNVHCSSCVSYAKEVLTFVPHLGNVEVSILSHEIRVHHGPRTTASAISKALIDAAFEVHHATTRDASGKSLADLDFSSHQNDDWTANIGKTYVASRLLASWPGQASNGKNRKHIDNCDVCKKDELVKVKSATPIHRTRKVRDRSSSSLFGLLSPKSSSSPKEDVIGDRRPEESAPYGSRKPYSDDLALSVLPEDRAWERPPNIDKPFVIEVQKGEAGNREPTTAEEYEAAFAIDGMTCASCSGSITKEIEGLDYVTSINVTLMTNSATVIYHGPKDNIEKIVNCIEDLGYGAFVEKVSQRLQHKHPDSQVGTKHRTNLSIGGMTCVSCVGTITRGLQELPFVRNVSIDLVGNSGNVEFEGKEHLEKITEKIEDLGYDATIVSSECLDKANDEAHKEGPTERMVTIKVEGMFCDHCPPKVVGALEGLPDKRIRIDETPTLKHPLVTVTYTPDPPDFTVRDIISCINSARDSFNASIHHPPSIEERSQAMQLQERRRLLIRLLFTFIVAIPTFLIGVVWMSLVPQENKIRIFFDQSMWAGSVSRSEWALFILTTPVMFFGADVFHTRALKEIRALWRSSSKMPILRRFYRFGSMNLLISAGTSVAYFSSLAILIIGATGRPTDGHASTYFDSVVFLTAFILAGKSLEAYSKAKTGDAVGMLGKLRPSEAMLVTSPSRESVESLDKSSSQSMQRVPVDFIEAGDSVIVPHGASPPADGVVQGDGTFQFDESSLTGESRPVKKVIDDKVFAGSVNVGQPVRIKVTEIGGTSMLDQIVSVVREGQTKRAPVERIADIITGYFVPVITLIAISTFIIWFALGQSGVLPRDYLDVEQGGWAFWALIFASAVFVVACPCGIGLAAPTALFVGGGLAAKYGILVRGGGEAFQEASHLDAIVFDKTGTLTEGLSLKVTEHDVLVSDEDEQKVAWALARAMEESSSHPIAKAIADFSASQLAAKIISSDIEEIPGQGMKGTFTVSLSSNENKDPPRYEAAIGNERLLHSLPSDSTKPEQSYFLTSLLSKYQSAGRSTAILSLRRLDQEPSSTYTPTLIFATSDPLRPTSASVVSQLQHQGLSVHMCTGDNPTTAHAVATSLGIPLSNVVAGVLPAGKADYIRSLQHPAPNPSASSSNKGAKKGRRTVAFVGDGTNDTPALTAADVSIALSSGSDIALSSASFILLTSDLDTVLQLIRLSKRVFGRVRANFVWAGIYNVLLVPVAAGIFYPIHSANGAHWRLGPVWASAAMAASSVSVVLSSLALRVEVRRMVRGWFGFGRGKGRQE